MTMKKVRLRSLWKCHTSKPQKARSPSERAIFGATVAPAAPRLDSLGEIRMLEIERSALKIKLSNISTTYRCNRKSNIAVEMANLVIEIDKVERKIIRLRK